MHLNKLTEGTPASREKIERVADEMITYYKKLGEGDELAGARKAKETVINRLIETILSADIADEELKDRAFYTRVSIDFLTKYEAIIKA